MKNRTFVVALAIITVVLVSCSKKSADTSITQQRAPGDQVVTVTNDGRVYRMRRMSSESITNTITQQKPSGTQVVANDDGSVSVVGTVIRRTNVDGSVSTFTTRIRSTTNSTPATSGPSK